MLITHLVEQYRDKLQSITYVDTFSSLMVKYDQLHDKTVPYSADEDTTPRNSMNGGKRWEGLKDLDAAEEEYFNGSDDDEEVEYSAVENSQKRIKTGGKAVLGVSSSASPAASIKSLVDYPDDDDVMDTEDAEGEPVKADSNSVSAAASDPGIENLNIASRASSVGADGAVEDGSSGTTTTTTAGAAAGDDLVMAGSLPPTPDRLSEKRRREEEAEEDGMERLLRSTKKRSPSVGKKGGVSSPSSTPGGGGGGGGGGNGKKISISFASKGENGKGKEDKREEKEKEKEEV